MTRVMAERLGAVMGFLAVALGAFGAHGLKGVLARYGTTEPWEKAVFYHFIHAVMLYFLARSDAWPRGPWWCFLVGTVLFSGSLYLLAVFNLRWMGMVTPLGGVSFLAGWLWLAISTRS